MARLVLVWLPNWLEVPGGSPGDRRRIDCVADAAAITSGGSVLQELAFCAVLLVLELALKGVEPRLLRGLRSWQLSRSSGW